MRGHPNEAPRLLVSNRVCDPALIATQCPPTVRFSIEFLFNGFFVPRFVSRFVSSFVSRFVSNKMFVIYNERLIFEATLRSNGPQRVSHAPHNAL